MKKDMSLSKLLDLTRDGVAEMTHWCVLIALHQEFGIGSQRLCKVEAAATRRGNESLAVAMQPNARGAPSTDASRALRESWVPEGVDKAFRVPVLRAPKNRKEEQLRMAGDVAASMVWCLYAAACVEVLGFGAKRLNQLKQATMANYQQVNREGHEDGLDVAMEHLRRCACAALQTDDIIVEDVPDEERVRRSEQEFEAEKREFLRRSVSAAMGRRCAAPGSAVLSQTELDKRIEAIQAAGSAAAPLHRAAWKGAKG